ncbi:MAG TPA: 5-oxoprolinase subunit PxpA [Ferruginibacter sp.]|nr:5-oxoprolinase subunit PxpA [Ferruginibacter sp.]
MPAIDLNCDMGEGFDNDQSIMAFVSSVNIACGFHAGNKELMTSTVESAVKMKISIGAHPGFPDKAGFGRTDMHLTADEIAEIIIYQVNALMAITKSAGTTLRHVKPHGALYNMAAKDPAIANAIARAVMAVDNNLILFGLSGSYLISEAKSLFLKTVSEVFADRTYQDDGSLTPRTLPGAMINDPDKAGLHALNMVLNGKVTTITGNDILVLAETICIHGDNPRAVEFAGTINKTLKHHHVSIRHP